MTTTGLGPCGCFSTGPRRRRPMTTLAESDTKLIADVCRRLDGLPLAIELAAARLRHLPLGELAAQLEEGLGPLEGGQAAQRHRTLEAAIDWTWDLLDDDERSVLSRLAALPRTFDLELAVAVTWPGADRVVLRLLDRSLISPAAKLSNPRRFRLLEPLRAYVLGKTKPDIVQQVRSAHAAHHRGMAIQLTQRARTDDSREAAELAFSLHPELNAAIRWAVETGNGIALPMTRALAIGIEQYGADIESLQTLAQAAKDTIVREAATADDLFFLGVALCFSDLDLVADLTALALSRATDDASILAAHHLAGLADAFADRKDSALTHLDVAEPLAAGRGDTLGAGVDSPGQGNRAPPRRSAGSPRRAGGPRVRDAHLRAGRRRAPREQRPVHDGLDRRRPRPPHRRGSELGRPVRAICPEHRQPTRTGSRLARARRLRHRAGGRGGPRRSPAGVPHNWRPALPCPLLPATRRPPPGSRTGLRCWSRHSA